MLGNRLTCAVAALALLSGAACSSGAAGTNSQSLIPEASFAGNALTGKYIKHVVIVVQENRSFDNFFAGWPGADTAMSGKCYNATTKQVQTMPLAAGDWSFLPKGVDLPHSFKGSLIDFDGGKMDGFCDALINPGDPAGARAYFYMKPSSIAPYRTLASQYVLADHMFPTEFGGSFPAHLNLIAGNDELTPHSAVGADPNGQPWGCDAPSGSFIQIVNRRHQFRNGPFPCFTQFRTLADTLDAANVSWKYYAPPLKGSGGGSLWIAFDAIAKVRCATFTKPDDCDGYGKDWPNIVSPETTFLTDAKTALPPVSWVIPSFSNSDHPGSDSSAGPSWVASVVNAVGHSKYWSSTAIVVVWDDWGGLYDNVVPPQLDYRGLGIRVPCLIISPYAKHNYVSHTQYEYGSVLKFIEEAFNLRPLGPTSAGYTDTRANSLLDSFNFTQKPRPFHTIPAALSASYFLAQPQPDEPPDSE